MVAKQRRLRIKPLMRIKIEETHWSEWLDDHACNTPEWVRQEATPERAWERADGEELCWMLNKFGVKHKFECDSMGTWPSAIDIRKKFPKPPRVIMLSLNKWLKAV